jgi:DNA-binding HxlR family transcriptional regulator
MEEILKKYSAIDHCPVRNIVSRFATKWGMLVLLLLSEKDALRFSELTRCLPDISPKVLSSTLKVLEDDGLVKRKVYPTVPPKVEYSITDTGKSLVPLLAELTKWALEHFDEILLNRSKSKR